MQKIFLLLGGILTGSGVLIGAFGAHGLKEILTKNCSVSTFETGVQYHFYHGLALLILGILVPRVQSVLLHYAGYSWIAGIVIFSGSLYWLSISGIRWLGAITPVGGLCFIAGWILFCIGVMRGM